MSVAKASLGAMLALAAFVADQPAGAEQSDVVVARLSYHFNPTHPSAVMVKRFVERVREGSDGALRVQTFPSGQVLGGREVVAGVASGAVQMAVVVGLISLPAINHDYSVAAVPHLFDGYDQLRGYFADTGSGRRIWSSVTRDIGLECVGYLPVGPSALFSARKDLSRADSLAGARARVLASSERPLWQALGVGRMVSVPTAELYSALQSGMVDTFTSVPVAVQTFSWWDFADSVQLPYLQYADAYLMVNVQWLDSLPPRLAAVVREAGAEMSREATADILRSSQASIDALLERGGRVFVLEGEEFEQRRRQERDKVYPAFERLLSPGVLAEAQAYAARSER
jgi:TRAP-type C4-dicarboxylate transport system substrate-binding protein